MTTTIGKFAYCGRGRLFSLELDCSGPACSSLDGFPNTTRSTKGSHFIYSNGITCPRGTNYSANFNFTVKDGFVWQTEQANLGGGEAFAFSIDGITGDNYLGYQNNSNSPITTSLVPETTSLPSSPATSSVSPSSSHSSGAMSARHPPRLSFLALLFLVLCCIIQGTAALSCAHEESPLGLAKAETSVVGIPESGNPKLRSRSESPFDKAFSDLYGEYVGSKVQKAANRDRVFLKHLGEEIGQAICEHFAYSVIDAALVGQQMSVAIDGTSNIVSQQLIRFLELDGEGAAMAAAIAAGVLANFGVNELFPDAGKEASARCEELLNVPEPCPTGEALLTDPKNCGFCETECESGQCINGACVMKSCYAVDKTSIGDVPCGEYGGSCICTNLEDGTGFCVPNNELLRTSCLNRDADGCMAHSDCELGRICGVPAGCQWKVCQEPDVCGGKEGLSPPQSPVTRPGAPQTSTTSTTTKIVTTPKPDTTPETPQTSTSSSTTTEIVTTSKPGTTPETPQTSTSSTTPNIVTTPKSVSTTTTSTTTSASAPANPTQKPWVFRLEEGSKGDGNIYQEEPAHLYTESNTYLLKSDGQLTANTACLTVFSTGEDGRWLNVGTDDGNALASGDTFYFGYDDGDTVHDSCCLTYFSGEECDKATGKYQTVCGAGIHQLLFQAPSWYVQSCTQTFQPQDETSTASRYLWGSGGTTDS